MEHKARATPREYSIHYGFEVEERVVSCESKVWWRWLYGVVNSASGVRREAIIATEKARRSFSSSCSHHVRETFMGKKPFGTRVENFNSNV